MISWDKKFENENNKLFYPSSMKKCDEIYLNTELTADDKIWSSNRDVSQTAQTITSHYCLKIHNIHHQKTIAS